MEKLLITGGTGTIGKELLKRLHNKYQIRVISRDELKQAKLKPLYPDVEFVITDVRDYRAVLKAMVGIDTVIHAAAMKRIEVCEQYPIEAVKTNIIIFAVRLILFYTFKFSLFFNSPESIFLLSL